MPEKSKGGRPPTYRKELAHQARTLCRFGATDVDLAEAFGVTEVTINRWKKSHPEFREALELGKPEADALVERALFERAIGWSHRAVKIMAVSGGKDAGTTIEEIPYIERFPPDVVAAIFWLKNRKPGEWRDKQQIEHELGASLEDLLTRSWKVPPPASPDAPPPAPTKESSSS